MKRTLLVFVACAVALTATGCVPNVVWLPDSSGFLFTESVSKDNAAKPQFRLVHFDVAKKARRVVVADLKDAYTSWTALSPDGKQVAVARMPWDVNQAKVQFVIYDLTGKELRRSKEFDWLKAGEKTDKADWLSLVFWSTPDKLLVTGLHKDLPGQTGIYDLTKDDLIIVKDRMPFLEPGNTPTRPDGAGFLAVGDKESNFYFIDWSGKTTNVNLKAGWATAENIVDFRWDGKKAILIGAKETATVDTATGAATYTVADPVVQPRKPTDQLKRRLMFAGNRLEFRIFDWEPNPNARETRFEILNPKTGKVNVLKEKTNNGFVFPSPDRRWLAVRTGDKILVIDSDGDIAAEVEAELK